MYTIIGGGIGGLTTALAFEKLNINYRVFESAPEINEVGAGIWLAPNALQVLEWLGLSDAIRSHGNVIERIQLAKADFSLLSDMDQSWAVEQFGCSTIAIHRAELQRILLKAIPREKVALGKSLEHFKIIDDAKVKLYFSDASQYDTDFLIGADGIHSCIRKQLYPESELRYSGQTCWRGIADTELAPKYAHLAAELWGKQIRFGFSRISKNSVYWFAVALSKAGRTEDKTLRKKKLLGLFSGFHPTVKNIISGTESSKIIRNDIWDLKPIGKWYRDQICLVGDAAHATTPNMGQGAAQAIEDAYYLAHQIRLQPDHRKAFKNFQSLRFKKVSQIVDRSWNIGKMAHWRFGGGLRNLIMSAIPDAISRKQMIKLYEIDRLGMLT